MHPKNGLAALGARAADGKGNSAPCVPLGLGGSKVPARSEASGCAAAAGGKSQREGWQAARPGGEPTARASALVYRGARGRFPERQKTTPASKSPGDLGSHPGPAETADRSALGTCRGAGTLHGAEPWSGRHRPKAPGHGDASASGSPGPAQVRPRARARAGAAGRARSGRFLPWAGQENGVSPGRATGSTGRGPKAYSAGPQRCSLASICSQVMVWPV